MSGHVHETVKPSPWIARFAGLIAPGEPVLDLACGGGRHARFMLDRGHPVTAVDRDVSGIEALRARPELEIIAADLEQGEWPLASQQFAGIIVTNYLYRPLFPHIMSALSRRGVLLYETFAAGNERFGRPRNPDHLLKRGELLEATRGHLVVIAYEDLEISEPSPACVQRIAARAPEA